MIEYKIKVKPGTSREEVVKLTDNELVIYLRARPHDGEANSALIKLLAKYFHVPKTTIEIIRGGHSREKTVRLSVAPSETDRVSC